MTAPEPTVTIRCSCGGTFEEPLRGLTSRPLSQWNYGEHGSHPLADDWISQVREAINGQPCDYPHEDGEECPATLVI